MSEVFVRHEDFSAQALNQNFGPLNAERLAGMATAYITSVEDDKVTGVEYVLSVNPAKSFELSAAAGTFLKGYRDILGLSHGMADAMLEAGTNPRELEEVALDAADLAHGARLLNVATVAVLGTAEDYSSGLLVPKKVVREMALAPRDKVIRSIAAGEELQVDPSLTPEETERFKHSILTQNPVWKHFAMFAAAGLLPRAAVLQGVIDSRLST